MNSDKRSSPLIINEYNGFTQGRQLRGNLGGGHQGLTARGWSPECINPYLANAATRIINNPEFQRVKDRLEDDLTQQTKNHLDQTNFEHSVTNLAVEARINRSDLDYIIGNLQQPSPPPLGPHSQGSQGSPGHGTSPGQGASPGNGEPPPHQGMGPQGYGSDAAADRARLIAELDGMAQERDRQSRQEMMAQRNAMDLAAQQVATPAQQIIREFHHSQIQPIYIPTPQVPPRENYSEMMRQMGLTMQQIFMQQQVPIQGGYRPPPDEIPITYNNQGPPPGAPPGGGMVLANSAYGPARISRERLTPFPGVMPPASKRKSRTPGGATSPPVPAPPAPLAPPAPPAPPPPPAPLPKRRNKFPGRGQRLPDELPYEPVRPPKRKAIEQGEGVKIPKQPQFPGEGHKLLDEPRFVPFRGQAQRLPSDNPDNHTLRANAIQRMRELGHQGMQKRRGREMVDRMGDLGRAIRRGGGAGDVVGPGKRKGDAAFGAEIFTPNPRQRIGDRDPGP
jgi:hypothetical protein